MMKTLLKGLIVAGLIFATNSAVAATVDGALETGASATTTGSNGSFDINVTKQDAVQISNLNSIVITTGGIAVAPVTGSDSVCYYATTNDYTVKMDSTSTATVAGDLKLVSGANSMSYKLDWAETTGTDTASWGVAAGGTINDNVATGNLSSDNKTSANCGGATNATITVTIPAATFNSAPTGLYTDTVNITLVGV
jgi:hypothetical protein